MPLPPPTAAGSNLDTLFDLAPCGLAVLGPGYVLTACNRYLSELVGRSPESMIGVTGFPSLLTVAGRIYFETHIAPLLRMQGRVDEVAFDLVTASGARAPVLLNAELIGELEGGQGVIRLAVFPASDRRKYEAEILRARREADAEREAAEAASKAKSDFLANMSHEIRTPLNAVVGVAGVLATTTLSTQQRDMVGMIETSGLLLERLVSDVLDLAKIESGLMTIEVRPFNLEVCIQGIANLMGVRAAEKGVAFTLRMSEAARGQFLGDGLRLQQVLANLLSNAIKFTSEGEVSLTVDVEPDAESSTLTRLRVAVRDSGIGFDESLAAGLFDRFSQADNSITRRFGGTGIGLSICKQLVDLMGGHIQVRSRPGAGSTFSFEIPLARPAAEAEAEAEADADADADADEAVGLADGPALRILLVEDNDINQKIVALMLAPLDVELEIASNGHLGLECFQRQIFDLVLMDMQMPVMDGLTATRAFRALEAADPARVRTPIALLSANAMEQHRLQGAEAGADLHISKPITPESLIAGVQQALRAGAAARPAPPIA
ncbi:ATP-binding protein [Caulobacter sp. ErkDOM-E]|uniref:ATP-binding protein n=1 Tax=Caulobacter sp. ErkDOM-E TaxID=3402778 RepID=UPI003AF4C829